MAEYKNKQVRSLLRLFFRRDPLYVQVSVGRVGMEFHTKPLVPKQDVKLGGGGRSLQETTRSVQKRGGG